MENLKRIEKKNKLGKEYFFARELQVVLEYKEWRNFKKIINKAIEECTIKNHNVENNIRKIYRKMQDKPFHIKEDYIISKYGCYLIIKNSKLKNTRILRYFRLPNK